MKAFALAPLLVVLPIACGGADDGKTALGVAVERKHEDAAKALRARGAR